MKWASRPRRRIIRPDETQWYRRPHLDHDAVHQWLWEHADSRGRMTIEITELVEEFGYSYPHTNKVIVEMREEGRMRIVGFAGRLGGVYRYQLADPSRYDPHDPTTHMRRPNRPAWG